MKHARDTGLERTQPQCVVQESGVNFTWRSDALPSVYYSYYYS